MKTITRLMLCLALPTLVVFNSCTNGKNEENQSDTANEWVNLFNGKDLSGWTVAEGNAKFEVEKNEIVGITVPNNTNGILRTDEDYDNFIFEVDVKVDSSLNSGIQIRSHVNDKGEVYGYQIEVDPSERAWSGGLYDSRRDGWIVDLENQPEKQSAFKNGEWNHYRIKANKDTIETWLNDVPIASYVDSLKDDDGFIGFQAHSTKESGLKVRFKNIRIMKL